MVKNINKRYRVQENKTKIVKVSNKPTIKDEVVEPQPKNNKNNKPKKVVVETVVSDNNNTINTKDNE